MAVAEDGTQGAATASPPKNTGGGGGDGHDNAAPKYPARVRKPSDKLVEERKAHHDGLYQQHLTSVGRQVVSHRATNRVANFSSPRVLPGKEERCLPISRHPKIGFAAPGAPPPPLADVHQTIVLKGFGQCERFADDTPPAKLAMAEIISSTKASPFSSTYPYQAPPPAPPADKSPTTSPSSNLTTLELPPTMDINRHHPQATRDLNCLSIRKTSRPAWSFGSSGIGVRLGTGTHPSRALQVTTSSRLQDFRELRDIMDAENQKSPRGGAAK